MFYRQSDASKLALLFLIEHLKSRGATWIDCQVMTPHMEALRAREIARGKFLDLLAAEQAGGRALFGGS
jgi:leucyl/phenylalanyl-tRNA--protein transferase